MTALSAKPGWSRTLLIAIGVLLLHALAIGALRAGLLQRATEIVVSVEAVSEVIVPPVPVPPPPPVAEVRPPRSATPVARPATASPPPAPQLAAPASPDPAPNAPTAAPVAAAPLPAITQPVSPAPVAARADIRPAAPAAPTLELPSSDADYLHNPKPAYPALSRRLGEQGTVQVRVLIGADGVPQKADIQKSSGFDRLDQAALATAMAWRYVPGKRSGTPEAMWFTVPIAFVLK